MDSEGPKFSRREILATGAVLPLLAARPGAALAESISPADAPRNPLPMAPKPDYVLRLAQASTSPLGKPTEATLVNGQLPGTEIRYREGDMFRVVIQNNFKESTFPSGTTTVHWHGLIVPSWMDGVPDLTQLPIDSDQSFYVEFPIV